MTTREHSFDLGLDELDNLCFELDQRSPKYPLQAGEAILYNDLIGVKSDGKAYKAKDGLVRCIGFCATTTGAATGEYIELRSGGLYSPSSALTPGTIYYNSSTSGIIGNLASAPTWGQVIGMAISTSTIIFRPEL